MSYDKTAYDDVDPAGGALYFLRDALDCEQLGVSVLEADADWTGMEHDHADEDHEEVYVLLDGAATLTVDGEDVPMEPGDAVRVDPGTARQIHTDDESRMVIAGAP